MEVRFIGIKLPLIEAGVKLHKLILDSIYESGYQLIDGDIILITLKIVSKAYNLLIDLSKVKCSDEAYKLAKKTGLDPKYLEVLIRESDEIIAAIPFKEIIDIEKFINKYGYDRDLASAAIEKFPTLFITVRGGMLWTDSGIDSSNHPSNIYSIPPRDPDQIARELSINLSREVGFNVPIILCDTEMFPWGAIDIPRGSYGLEIITNEFGKPDLYGKPKFGGVDNIAYPLCGAAGLLFRQSNEGIPVVIARGVEYKWVNSGMKCQMPIGYRNYLEAIKKIIKYNIRILGVRRVLKTLTRYLI